MPTDRRVKGAPIIDEPEVRGTGRFLVFGGAEHYPSGGAKDLDLRTDSLNDAKLRAHEMAASADWAHIFDSEVGRIVYEARGEYA